MEFLKKLIIIFLLFASVKTFTQNNPELQTAFIKSYEFEAKKEFEKAINAIQNVYNENSYEINLRLGWLHYLNSDFIKSINFYQKASLVMPASTEALWLMVDPLTLLERWNDLEKTYLRILKIDTKNSTASYRLGLIYYYRKNYVNAKKYFDICLNLFPFNYDFMLMSAWTNYFLGNKNAARILFNKVLLYNSNDVSALEGLSLLNN